MAIAPLMWQKARYRGMPIRQLAFLGSLTPRRAILFRNGVIKIGTMAVIVKSLGACRSQWDILSLLGLEQELSDLDVISSSLKAGGFTVLQQEAYNTPYINIGDDFPAFLRTSLSRASRQSMGRKVRPSSTEF